VITTARRTTTAAWPTTASRARLAETRKGTGTDLAANIIVDPGLGLRQEIANEIGEKSAGGGGLRPDLPVDRRAREARKATTSEIIYPIIKSFSLQWTPSQGQKV